MTISNSHSKLTSLNEWLFYLESIHSKEIDMGLERISKVASRLAISLDKSKVITVAGTNGKGTTCAFIEHALLAQGHSVAVYSSPHIEKFNERLRINAKLITDEPLIDAFNKIEQARAEISLTYYEFTTLAALIICQQIAPEFVILEVGLGGRLDATNIIDSDVAVITSIDLDHQAFLGNDRSSIGKEKAGIVRANKPVIIGEPAMPTDVLEFCEKQKAISVVREQDFFITNNIDNHWTWQYKLQQLKALPLPFIPQDNVATALTTLTVLGFELEHSKVSDWILNIKVEGRTEIISEQPLIVVDVAHNPHAARYLAKFVQKQNVQRVFAVTAMLADKDIKSTLQTMLTCVDHWYVGSLDVPRGASGQIMSKALKDLGKDCNSFDNITDAYRMALDNANNNDMILVFGSFFTVAKIKQSLF
ncbi:bifunctional tetrahydrofolate synthase/dihydrofolate synthase [Thalassomonas sp. M1454]|uniref:bifunctional tetrahydrofolate synthase/dihydrofolate synthase n=1 Tax=Thalassomonas sp. M1454 TaxID=2594477 RepID=UPI00117D3606|nr:bifunctional tetrahydrofolate synthase/dihydrofolate synthase [Thalassomonas sp. M1454]TRX57275.1 bifunctional tetrahydrofolate synthase/dihydrofolate synthase [Thalassomonas sp. M1454]